jgi:hypothetical protein
MTSALDGGEWSASRPSRFTPREGASGTHCIGGWLGPRASRDAMVKREIPTPLSGLKTSISQLLVQRYTAELSCKITCLISHVCHVAVNNCFGYISFLSRSGKQIHDFKKIWQQNSAQWVAVCGCFCQGRRLLFMESGSHSQKG